MNTLILWMPALLMLPAFLTSLATLIASLRNTRKIDALHATVDGVKTELVQTTQAAAFAEGKEAERKDPS